jgi:hypothetical protein
MADQCCSPSESNLAFHLSHSLMCEKPIAELLPDNIRRWQFATAWGGQVMEPAAQAGVSKIEMTA